MCARTCVGTHAREWRVHKPATRIECVSGEDAATHRFNRMRARGIFRRSVELCRPLWCGPPRCEGEGLFGCGGALMARADVKKPWPFTGTTVTRLYRQLPRRK